MNALVEGKTSIKDQMEAVWTGRGCRQPRHLCLWEIKGGRLVSKRGPIRSPLNSKPKKINK